MSFVEGDFEEFFWQRDRKTLAMVCASILDCFITREQTFRSNRETYTR